MLQNLLFVIFMAFLVIISTSCGTQTRGGAHARSYIISETEDFKAPANLASQTDLTQKKAPKDSSELLLSALDGQ